MRLCLSASLLLLGLSNCSPTAADDALVPALLPSAEEAGRVRNDVRFENAVAAYRFWYPTVSAEALFQGNREAGYHDNEVMPILSAGPRHVGFTLNSDTPYGAACLDLTDGPYVVDIPAGLFVGVVNDHHQGWVQDLGLSTPATLRGGKYVIVPPGYQGELPKDYYVGRASTYKVFVAIRSIPLNGELSVAIAALKKIKIYPLVTGGRAKVVSIIDVTEKSLDFTPLRWEDNLQFWKKLNDVIQFEPICERFLPMYGMLASIGMEKGKKFEPDAETVRLLERAATTGRRQMLASAFASDRVDRIAWPDRRWEWAGLVPENAQFESSSGIDLDARDRWFAQAIVTSPAMFRRKAGTGSLYWVGLRDQSGGCLDGGNSYKLTIPQPVPARLFWSVTVYDAATRSEIQTAQDKAALRSMFELKQTDQSQPLDLYFGPKAPEGHEDRWLQTNAGRPWFAYFRIYGPQDSAFDGSWKPGDFAELK